MSNFSILIITQHDCYGNTYHVDSTVVQLGDYLQIECKLWVQVAAFVILRNAICRIYKSGNAQVVQVAIRSDMYGCLSILACLESVKMV